MAPFNIIVVESENHAARRGEAHGQRGITDSDSNTTAVSISNSLLQDTP